MRIYKKTREANRNSDKKQLEDVEGRGERVIIDVSYDCTIRSYTGYVSDLWGIEVPSG